MWCIPRQGGTGLQKSYSTTNSACSLARSAADGWRVGPDLSSRQWDEDARTHVRLILWVDSRDERGERPFLEQRVDDALTRPETLQRFGGLSLGESTHLVDEVARFPGSAEKSGSMFVCADRGRLTLPVWVDHVGSAGTRYVTGDLRCVPLIPPDRSQLPVIEPPEQASSPKRTKRRARKNG